MTRSPTISDREPELDVRVWLEAAVASLGAPTALRDLFLSRVVRPPSRELDRHEG